MKTKLLYIISSVFCIILIIFNYIISYLKGERGDWVGFGQFLFLCFFMSFVFFGITLSYSCEKRFNQIEKLIARGQRKPSEEEQNIDISNDKSSTKN